MEKPIIKREYTPPIMKLEYTFMEGSLCAGSSTVTFGNPNEKYRPQVEEWTEETKKFDINF